MTNKSSIKYISGLLDNPGTLTEGDHSSIASFRQSFPYFVPARYLEALEKHRKEAFSPAMLSAAKPYIGNWMLFCDFLGQNGNTQVSAAPAIVPETEDEELFRLMMEEEAMNKATDEQSKV